MSSQPEHTTSPMPKVPEFLNEAEEAQWWFQNQDAFLDNAEVAAQDGSLQRVSVSRDQSPAELVSLQLAPADRALAQKQAESRGLSYEIYLAELIHNELAKLADVQTPSAAAA